MPNGALPPRDDRDDEAYWRRPADPPTGKDPGTPLGSSEPQPVPYTGPPRGTPPPAGWHPPLVERPRPPRQLPPQNHEALDRQEREAMTLTKGIAIIALAVMFVLFLLLCGRWLF